MQVLIYGLGKEALLAEKALRKEHTVIGFTDSFANIKSYAGLNFYHKEAIRSIYFDYIVLALSSRRVAESIEDELIREGVEKARIIDFMYLFTRQKVDKVMHKSGQEKVDGIILGLSHALFGINPTYLSGTWKNLAVQGEDLYYHYKVLQKCVDCYPNMINDLKYAVIDMYDYPFFNYDLSLTKGILGYWAQGGYAEDLHHFDKNRNYIGGGGAEKMKCAGFYFPITSEINFRLAEKLFDVNEVEHEMEKLHINASVGYEGFRDYPIQVKLDKVISEEPLLPYNLYYMGEERYPETIEENQYVLKEMIKLFKQINPKIKIYFVLMPRFGKMEKYHAALLNKEKEEFENMMDTCSKDEGCCYFNFKECEDINSNRHFFWDVAHLNYIGAIAFTGLLNNRINGTI